MDVPHKNWAERGTWGNSCLLGGSFPILLPRDGDSELNIHLITVDY